jgi:hypothetical protein
MEQVLRFDEAQLPFLPTARSWRQGQANSHVSGFLSVNSDVKLGRQMQEVTKSSSNDDRCKSMALNVLLAQRCVRCTAPCYAGPCTTTLRALSLHSILMVRQTTSYRPQASVAAAYSRRPPHPANDLWHQRRLLTALDLLFQLMGVHASLWPGVMIVD